MRKLFFLIAVGLFLTAVSAFLISTSNAALLNYDEVSVVAPIPIPAAVWLFGSTLGLFVWIKRRELE